MTGDRIEVRYKPIGVVDEVFAEGAQVHIEQMSATHWWMSITVGKACHHVNFHSKATIKINVADETPRP